jgi:hypothetical protein
LHFYLNYVRLLHKARTNRLYVCRRKHFFCAENLTSYLLDNSSRHMSGAVTRLTETGTNVVVAAGGEIGGQEKTWVMIYDITANTWTKRDDWALPMPGASKNT